jgi:hypothetical protein
MQALIRSTLCAAAVCALAPNALAQSSQPANAAAKQPGIDALDCRTLLRLGGDERAYTLLYYHGFVSGQLGQMDLPTDVMAAATDKIIEQCIDKPGEKVLTVFEQVRKQR